MDRELKFLAEKVIKKETNTILNEIDRFMDEDGAGDVLAKKVPGRKQFKTLMDATKEAACIEELLLFLSYQRSKKGGWDTKCANGKEIAINMAESFMKVQNKVLGIIETEAQKISDDDERLLRLEIAEKYMGYLYWKASVVGGFREGE